MYRTLLLTIIAFCLFAGSAFAAVPLLINYQGILTDSLGDPVADAAYMIKFIVWDDPTATGAGNDKWNSGFQTVNTVDGLFEYQLGSNVNLPDNLFSNRGRWLGITVRTEKEISPRTRLVSVGYAFNALRADTAGVSASVFVNSIGSAEVIDNSLTARDLAPSSVTGSELAADAVNNSKMTNNSIGSAEVINNSLINADINSSAAIDVTKISGTAVNLSSTQTITGQKQFGDSTMIVNNIGIRIGDNVSPSSLQLIRVQRDYNTADIKYGYHSILNNQGAGIIVGVFSNVTNNNSTGSDRYALLGASGNCSNTLGTSFGVYGRASGGVGSTVFGVYGIAFGNSTAKYAGYFQGDVNVVGTLFKSLGAFKIDHPLDPANKYLVHSFVESPDMMNVYNGNVTLDGNGTVAVTLPDYFDALNKDYRYQLTSIGAPGPNLYIASEISGNQFVISGGEPNSKVSWQVTGVRKDAYAEAHRIKVEPDKPIAEKGLYLHPVELGLSETKQLHYEMHKAQLLERERMASESTQ